MIGNRIKELRSKANMLQQDLARELHVSKATIGMWETNKRTPDLDMLNVIANYFNVPTDYLLGRTNDLNSNKSQIEKSDIFTGQYSFRVNIDELFNVNSNNGEIEKVTNMQLNYGWKLISLEEEKGQRFLVLKWEKEGRPDVDPFERA